MALRKQVQELSSKLSLLEAEKSLRTKERKSTREAMKQQSRRDEALRLEHLMVNAAQQCTCAR